MAKSAGKKLTCTNARLLLQVMQEKLTRFGRPLPFTLNPLPYSCMGLFDRMKMAQDMLKGMSPEQVQQLMAEAKEAQKTMKDQVREAVQEEIQRLGLISREELERVLQDYQKKSQV